MKGHSQGEYVFDYAWANAYARAGGDYYPKLQTAVPFTPVTGARILVKPGTDAPQARLLLASAAAQLAQENKASSWHGTFVSETEWNELGGHGFLQRTGTQYHWFNDGYDIFDTFLSALASRKRKAIRKEREQARASGLEFRYLTGTAITEAEWDAFFAFYMDTGNRKWGTPYLNRKCFSLLGQNMRDRLLLVMAYRGNTPVAGALNVIGHDTLYGRYWGCVEHHPFLHFEVCYYQAIDFAIANKLRVVEAGAQGEHKLARGYRPVTTYSLHYIRDRGFADAVARYLEQEREAVAQEQTFLEEMMPFRRDACLTETGG
jgi:predicted N-acyltransferase